MKAEIMKDGFIHVYAETIVEVFAMKHMIDRQAGMKEPLSIVVVHERVIETEG